jgi:two-component system response regulator YesN
MKNWGNTRKKIKITNLPALFQSGGRLTALKSKYFINLLLSLLLASLLIISMITVTIYRQFLREYKANTLTESQSSIASAESMFTQKLLDIKSMAYVVYRNPAFTYYPYPQDSDPGTDMNIVRQLQNYSYSNPFFADITFYRLSEPNTVYSSYGEFDINEMQSYVFSMPDMPYKDDFNSFKMYKGTSRLQESNNKTVYAFIEPLSMGNLHSGKMICLFVYKQSLDQLFDTIFHDKNYALYILDENDSVIYTGGTLQGLDTLVNTLNIKQEQSQFTRKTSNQEYHFFTVTSSYNSWKYVLAMENDELFTVYHKKMISFNTVITIMLLFVVVLSAFIAIYNYSPIRKLFGKVAVNFSDSSIDQFHRDELKYIGSVVDSIMEAREISRQRAVLSNLLWGQYDDQESALNDSEEAAIQFPYQQFLVGVIARSPRHHDENLKLLENALSHYNAVIYSAGLLNKEMDAIVINYDDSKLSIQQIIALFKQCDDLIQEGTSIGLGEPVDSVLILEKSFLQAKNAFTCLSGGQDIVRYADCLVSLQNMDISGYRKDISSAIRRGNTEEAVDRLSDLLNMAYDHSIPYERFKFLYYNILSMLCETAKKLDLPESEEFDRAAGELMTDAKLSRREVGHQLEQLTVHLCELVNRNNEKEEDNALLEKIHQVIEDHLCDQLMSLEMLAEQCGVSTSYLGRYFKSKTGYTPMRYVDIRKMEYAKKLLRETDYSLNEIVTKSGYIDASNFIRKFKKETGITPINYRKNYVNSELKE